jgi:ribosomal protein S18 acetylase RimI-like enzyme
VPPKATIEYATQDDLPFLRRNDRHISDGTLSEKVARGEVLIARLDGAAVGWLRYGLFWDTIPFMNMLVLLEPYRGRGIGRRLVTFWETEMKRRGHRGVLTSTQGNETAQHFYRKLGYADVGRFVLPDEPGPELLLYKLLA